MYPNNLSNIYFRHSPTCLSAVFLEGSGHPVSKYFFEEPDYPVKPDNDNHWNRVRYKSLYAFEIIPHASSAVSTYRKRSTSSGEMVPSSRVDSRLRCIDGFSRIPYVMDRL